jgi:hypothetical protein
MLIASEAIRSYGLVEWWSGCSSGFDDTVMLVASEAIRTHGPVKWWNGGLRSLKASQDWLYRSAFC